MNTKILSNNGLIKSFFLGFLFVFLGLLSSNAWSQAVFNQFEKLVIINGVVQDPNATVVLNPGDDFIYRLVASCTEPTGSPGGCVNAQIVDSVPSNLNILEVAAGTNYTFNVDNATNVVTVDFTSTFGNPQQIGLANGESGTIDITVEFPTSPECGAGGDGATETNQATITADNVTANAGNDASNAVEVTCEIVPVPNVENSKSMTPSTALQGSGEAVTVTHTIQNTSNSVTAGATSLTILDAPSAAGGVSDDFWDTHDFTGFGAITFPGNADLVQVDVWDGTAFVTGTPGATPVLPTGITNPDVRGLRYIFTSSTGGIDSNSSAGSVVSNYQLRDTNLSDGLNVTDSSNRTITNCSSGEINTADGVVTEPTTGVNNCDSITVLALQPSVTGAKSYSPTRIEDGTSDPVTVTLSARNNGNVTLDQITITEPAPAPNTNTPFDIFDFANFSGITCPQGATSYDISYVGSTTVQTGIPCGTAPSAPLTPESISQLTVTFNGAMPPAGSSGSVAFTLEQDPATYDTATPGNDVADNNTISVSGAAGAANVAANNIDATVTLFAVVNEVEHGKSMNPLLTAQGTNSTIRLTTSVTGNGRVDQVILEDVGTVNTGADFWSNFDAVSVQANDVPSTLDVHFEALVAGVWTQFGPTQTGGGGNISANMSLAPANAEGFRIVYTDNTGNGIPSVPPNQTQPQFEAQILVVALTGDADGIEYENCGTSGFVRNGEEGPDMPTQECVVINVSTSNGLISNKLQPSPSVIAATPENTLTWPMAFSTERAGAGVVVLYDATHLPNNSNGSIFGNNRVFEVFDLIGLGDIDVPRQTRTQLQITTDGGATWNRLDPVSFGSGASLDADGYIASNDGENNEVIELPAGSYVIPANVNGVRQVFVPRTSGALCNANINNPADSAGNPWGIPTDSLNNCFLPQFVSQEFELELRARSTYRSTGNPILPQTDPDDDGVNPTDYPNSLGWVNCKSVESLTATGATETDENCAEVEITAPIIALDGTKSFNPNTAVLSEAEELRQTSMTITAINQSNTNLTNLNIVDPNLSAPGAVNVWEFIDLTGDIIIDTSGMDGVAGGTQFDANIEVIVDGTSISTTSTLGGPVPRVTVPSSPTTTLEVIVTPTGDQLFESSNGSFTITAESISARLTERTSGAAITNAYTLNNNATVGTSDSGGFESNVDGQLTLIRPQFGAGALKTLTPAVGNRDLLPETTARLRAQNTGQFAANEIIWYESFDATSRPNTADWFDAFDFVGFGTPVNVPAGFDQWTVELVDISGNSIAVSPPEASPQAAFDTFIANNTINDPSEVEGLIIRLNSSTGTAQFTNLDDPVDLLINYKMRRTLRSDPLQFPMTGVDAYTNDVSVQLNGETTENDPVIVDVSSSFTVNEGVPRLTVVKTEPAGGALPGALLTYTITIQNNGTGNLVDPIFEDNFGPTPGFEYDPADGFTYTPDADLGTTPSNLQSQPTLDTSTPGTLAFTWPAGEYLAVGQTVTFEIPVRVTPATFEGTQLTNEAQVRATNPNQSVTCTADSVDVNVDIDNSGTISGVETATPNTCSDRVRPVVGRSSGFNAVKFSRAVGDYVDPTAINTLPPVNIDPTSAVNCVDIAAANNGWVRFPCVAVAVPGQQLEYLIQIQNAGNIAANDVTFVDVLPFVGDQFSIVPVDRGTEFDGLVLAQAPTVTEPNNGTTTITYTEGTPCVEEISGGTCAAGDWGPLGTLANTTGIRFNTDFGTNIFEPADTIDVVLTFDVPDSIPNIADDGLEIAWNNFSYRGTDANDVALFSESTRAGGAFGGGGELFLTKSVTGEEPTTSWSFDFSLTPAATEINGPTATGTGNGAADSVLHWGGLVPNTQYTLTETSFAGYMPGELVCTDRLTGDVLVDTNPAPETIEFTTPAGNPDPDATVAFTLDCEINNLALQADLQLTKTVEGFAAQASSPDHDWSFDFTLTPAATQGTNISPITGTANGGGVVNWSRLVPGTEYVLAEVAQPGFTAGELTCVDGNSQQIADSDNDPMTFTFVAPIGDDNASGITYEINCAIVNTVDVVEAQVTKTVAGADAARNWSFEFNITPTNVAAPTLVTPDNIADGTGSSTSTDVVAWTGLIPGAEYVISEVAQSGYTQGAMTCTGITDTDGDATNASVTFIAPIGDGDTNTLDDIDCQITNTLLLPDLRVTKSVQSNSTNPWQFGFTLTPTATVVDASPVTGVGTGTAVVSWNILPGIEYTISEDVASLTGYTAGAMSCAGVTDTDGDATNASVTFVAPIGDENAPARTFEVDCTITNQQWPDLVINKTMSPDQAAQAGDELTFTIEVSNNGILPATDVVVEDVLPDGLTYVSDDSGGSYDINTGAWTVGTLNHAETRRLVMTTLMEPSAAQCGTQYNNVASVTSQGEQDYDDTNHTSQVNVSLASLALLKNLAGNAAIDNGDGTYTVKYELMVVNNGSVDLFNLQIEEDLMQMLNTPNENNAVFEVVSVESPNATLTPNQNYDGVTAGDINLLDGLTVFPAGAQGRIDVTVTVTPDVYFGPFDNQARAVAFTSNGVEVSDLSEDAAITPNTPGLSSPFQAAASNVLSNEEDPDNACAVNGPTPFEIMNIPPTPITLGAFRSTDAGNGRVYFEWATESETSNVGYILWQSNPDNENEWVRLSPELIQSQGDSITIQRYQYAASNVTGQKFRLTDISVTGKQVHHGPFELGQQYGEVDERKATDWQQIQYESEQKEQQREMQRRQELEQRLRNSIPENAPEMGSHSSSSLNEEKGNSGLGRFFALLLSALVPSANAVELMNMEVEEPGVYRVSHTQLTQAGLDLNGIELGRIGLKSSNQLVPVRIVGANETHFGPGGYIEFPAQSLKHIYAQSNKYTLVIDEGQSLITDDASIIPQDMPAAYSYLAQKKYAPANHYTHLSPDRSGDAWYADDLKAIDSTASKQVNFYLDDYAPAFNVTFNNNALAQQIADVKPSVNVTLWGGSNLAGDGVNNPDHRVLIDVNGERIRDERFDGISLHRVNQPLAELLTGNNTVTITVPQPTTYNFDLVKLDEVSINYPRKFIAKDGGSSLVFTANWGKFRVRSLSDNNVTVYRIHKTNDHQQVGVRMTDVEVGVLSGYGNYALFPGRDGLATYFVTTPAGIKQPELSIAPSSADLFDGPAKALIIAHSDFIGVDGNPLENYAAELSDIYGSADVVDVHAIYARYSGHVKDANAIYEYVKDAYEQRGTRHLTIVGGDVYDYHNNLGLNAKSFVPSLYVSIGQNLNSVPSDAKYGDIDNDNIPDINVSRWPVRTELELLRLVSKRQAYKQRNYTNKAVFSADKKDNSGYSFKSDAETIVNAYFADWSVNEVFLDDIDKQTAKSRLVNSINSGVSLTSYFGHSSTNTWSLGGFFSGDDAARLANYNKPTVVTQWGCWNTFYVSPEEDSFAHRLLLENDSGAVTIMGATSLTQASAEKLMAELLFERLQQGLRIGEAVLSAKQEFATIKPNQLDVLLGWSVLGPTDLIVFPQ